jgi:DNA-binding HxlR family transcriptional regulator
VSQSASCNSTIPIFERPTKEKAFVDQREKITAAGDRMSRSSALPKAEMRVRRAPSRLRAIPGRKAIIEAGERNCSVARTLDIVSDAWAFLVIREAFFETRTFEAFRVALGIPRSTLTDRLRKLTRLGIFKQVASTSGARMEYRLTQKGFDLYPSFIALMQFGDRWLAGNRPPPLRLLHTSCCCETHPIVACSACLSRVNARDASYRDGPGAGGTAARAGRNTRRASDTTIFAQGRPSSVSRALQIIGDKWSFMVVREGFFGIRRYDQIQARLGIAPNILTDRLSRLVATGVFRKQLYQTTPKRYEYVLTDMGLDLYGPFIAMLAWGDRWLSRNRPPLLLHHKTCGNDFRPMVICKECKKPIVAADMRYKLNYDPKDFGALGPRSID